jgi:hypothetical protein
VRNEPQVRGRSGIGGLHSFVRSHKGLVDMHDGASLRPGVRSSPQATIGRPPGDGSRTPVSNATLGFNPGWTSADPQRQLLQLLRHPRTLGVREPLVQGRVQTPTVDAAIGLRGLAGVEEPAEVPLRTR